MAADICPACARDAHGSCADIVSAGVAGEVLAVVPCACLHGEQFERAAAHYDAAQALLRAGDKEGALRHAQAALALLDPKPVGQVVNLGARLRVVPPQKGT